MTRKIKNRIIIIVNIVLVIALALSVFAIVKTSNELSSAKIQLEHKQTAVDKQAQINKELESEISTAKEANKKLESEKEKLQKENSSLKKTIKELKAKKAAEEKATAVVNKNPVKKPTAVKQNPKPTGKVCYLTFDDGPTKNTLKILNILDKYKVKATFFVIDTPQTKIEYVKKIHKAGHTVGLHSSSHNYSKIYSSTNAYFADLNKISKTVENLIGVKSKVIRFPGGGSNTVSMQYKRGIMSTLSHQVTNKGYTYFDWNLDSEDASATTVSQTKIANNVIKGAKNKSSVCVLMHDAASKTTTVDALPKIITGLKKQGYTFKPLTKDCYGYHHTVQN